MLSRYFLLLLTLTVVTVPMAAAQQATSLVEDLPAATAAQAGTAVAYLERNWNRHGLASEADVAELVITDLVTSRRHDRASVHLRQGMGGIPVIDGQMTIAVDGDGHVFHAAGRLIPDLPSRPVRSVAGVSAVSAVETILREAGFPAPEPFSVVSQEAGPTRKTTLLAGDFTYQPVTADLAYIVDDSGALRLVWDATVLLHGDDGQWRGLVDAGSGEVLRLDDVLVRDHFGTSAERPLIIKDERLASAMVPRPSLNESPLEGECYRVFAWPLMDPFHADPAWPDDGRTWECDPFDPVASPGGWHDDTGDGNPDYTILRGNNAHAFPDHSDSDAPNPGEVDGGEALHFDFPIDFSLDPHDYMEASATNLFYWNNLFHDVILHYGFDEAHGNFQEHNYTSDGVGGDYVNANAQDGGGTNNANFSRTVDGQHPRMQMYLGVNFDPRMDGSLDNHVVLHEYGHGVSIRMTGGPQDLTCLSNAEHGGEGWSDWYGLMLTQDGTRNRNTPRAVGLFLFHDDRPGGIRPTPYSTDFGVNSTTYGDVGGLVAPHGVGYAWATVLWEVTWDVIDEYGFEQDIFDVDALTGNIIMMNVVTEALNLQPCYPGFVDQRDAILAAVDVVYGDQTEEWRSDLKQVLWGGFARRGLGWFAEQGSPSSTGDETEDFTVPSDIAPNPITDLVATPDGDFVTLTWTAPEDEDSDVTRYTLRYANEAILTEEDWNNAIEIPAVAHMTPQAPGVTEEFVVTGLAFETEYHFAIKSDDILNLSDLSNDAGTTTLAPPVATVPLEPIEVTVPAEGTDTVEYTISNAGPSTLRYFVSLSETTEAVVSGREAVERPTSEESEIPERDSEEAPDAPGEPQLMDEGGPDAFGYRWVDSNEPGGPIYNWIDISETGTEVELGVDDHTIVDLPWVFPYYDSTFDWVAIQSNGSLTFEGETVPYTNAAIPSDAMPNALLAAYWDDFNPSASSGGGSVLYGTDELGRFVVSWVDVPHFCGISCADAGSFTFQVILDPGGTIVTQYQEIDPGNYPNSATIGIENLDGTDGLEVVYSAEYVENELAIRFSSLWASSNPSGGQVAAGEEETITLTFDTEGFEPGTYTADMTVNTNEPGGGLQEYVIPITLTVEGVGTEDEDLAFEGTHRLSPVAPNPVNGTARTTLEVAETQDVRVELFDVRGRKVATAFEGALPARTAQEIALDGSTLAPGVYVLRISGETFAETRRVTVLR